jgi:hypothetical protein
MKNRVSVVKILLGLTLLGTVVSGSTAIAGKPKPPSGCPKAILCLDVWNPVVCADGITYSNSCYADRACAPGPCTPAGGGPVEVN